VRHAIVTGGSGGIGLALVRRLVADGVRVSVLALGDERLEALAAISSAGRHTVHVEPVDVRDRSAVRAAVTRSEAEHGPCDLLVTCAGVGRPGRFVDLEDDEFERGLDVNYLGTLHPVRAVVAGMIERGRGDVVLVSSFAALLGLYGYSAYAPTKYAVRGLAETLRTELRPHGIHVACAYPTDVDTPMLAAEEPLKPPELRALASGGRVLTAEEVADTILRGIRDRRASILCDRRSAWMARFAGAAPGLTRRIVDLVVARAADAGPFGLAGRHPGRRAGARRRTTTGATDGRCPRRHADQGNAGPSRSGEGRT
jgi:3-dehydrosphinganine reductase